MLLPAIQHTPVLHILSELQRTLDVLDCEGLAKLREEARLACSPLDDSSDNLALELEPGIEEWVSSVGTYQSTNTPRDCANLDPSDLRYYELAYLLSATFKDCSVIICSPSSPMEQDVIVKVIDLDTKSLRKMRQWEKLDLQIVETYAEIDEGLRRRCLDTFTRSPRIAERDVELGADVL